MFSKVFQRVRPKAYGLPQAAKEEYRKDRRGLAENDPGADRVIDESVAWLGRAQDSSASHDGGVARHYSLIDGWATSYPETTGYIVPTMLKYARLRESDAPRRRARRMLDWLVAIQFPDGSFQGGRVSDLPKVPVTFNTGQILLGLVAGAVEFRAYRQAMCRAADWLVSTQDEDGCWRKHPSPFAGSGEKTYDTHVAWGLLEAAQLEPESPYRDAALANVAWALTHQRENGWPDNCCLTQPQYPLTHTLGYFLTGIVEAYRHTNDAQFLAAARLTADGLLGALRADGFLAGRLYPDWRPAVDWACLTGSSQIAYCWLRLYECTGDVRYRDAGRKTNQFVRRTIAVSGRSETRGGVKGAFPVNGDYGQYQYLSWAAKFCIDASMLERAICAE